LPRVAGVLALAVACLGTACARGAGKGQAGRPAQSQGGHASGDGATAVPASLFAVPTSAKVVALTYDDGPGAGTQGTPAILALLAEHGARATFFVLGEEVRKRPEVLRSAARAGMEIENHGDRHVNMATLGPGALRRVIAAGATAIERETGKRPHFLRPPFGAQDARVRAVAHAQGERVVIWSVDTRDWTNPGSGLIVQRVLGQLRPGAIVLLHDGGADRSQTVEATRQLLPALQARGYRVVTLDRLLQIAARHPLGASDGGGSGPTAAEG
jgi:peptidoglycan/xylan/chitin deacetylase (PgdA/CDA1 family)